MALINKPVSMLIEADMPYRIIEFDAGLCQLLGYSIVEFKKTKLTLYDIMTKQDFTRAMTIIDDALSVSNYVDTKLTFTNKAEEPVIVLFNGQGFVTTDDKLVLQCSISDITHLERKMAETNKAKSDLDKFANSIPSGLSRHILDNNFSVFWANNFFYNLFGCTKEEFTETYNRNTFSAIYPPDLAVLISTLADLSDDHDTETIIRIMCKDEDVRWVNISLAHAGENKEGFPVINMVTTDITELKQAEQLAYLEKMKYDILSDITEELAYEYSITDKVLTFAEKYTQIFNGSPIIYDPGTELFRQGLICEESIDNAARLFANTLNGTDFYSTELILNTKTGKQWFLATFSTVRDAEGNPVKLIGLLRNINKNKLETTALAEKAESDLMTGLLNKSTTERRIKDKLRLIDNSGNTYLLLVDIDNFKSINDTYGHLVGDEVILAIADSFREVIDARHIVGRTGGDEFTVLLSDIPSYDIAEKTAIAISSTLKQRFSAKNTQFVPTLSIGIVAAKQENTYNELVEHADTALYDVKLRGKDGYSFYTDDMERHQYINERENSHGTNKASDKSSETNMAFIDDLVDLIAMRQNTYQTIEKAFNLIGSRYNIDRIVLFEYDNSADNSKVLPTHIWDKDDNPRAQALKTELPSYFFEEVAKLSSNGLFHSEKADAGNFASAESISIFKDSHRFMQYTITYKRWPVGYITFISKHKHTKWSEKELAQFGLISKILAETVLSSYKTDNLADMKEDLLSSYHSMNQAIMIVGIDSHEIIYANPSAYELIPGLTLGSKCHNVICQNNLPCANCPIHRLSENVKSAKAITYSPSAKTYFEVSATPIRWDYNIRASVITLTPTRGIVNE